MFQFTDADGAPVTAPTLAEVETLTGSDIRNLPAFLAAAEAADRAGYCGVYDDIAQQIGAPTRYDLREMGLVKRWFNVEVTRPIEVTVEFNESRNVRVFAATPAQAREAVESGEVEYDRFTDEPTFNGYDIRAYVDRYAEFTPSTVGEASVGHARAE